MADDLNPLLDSDKAIEQRFTPFGRQLGVKMTDQYGMYQIAYTDGKPGDLPDVLCGRWTSGAYCEQALVAYLRQLWEFSNQKAQKLAKPLAHTQQSKQNSAQSQP